MESTAIFIRSYRKDFEWLAYCLRSIQKYCTGFSEIIIAVPQGDAHLLAHLTEETVIPVYDGQPGYLCQQSDKLHADFHTRADYILHVDSDSVFTTPTAPNDFLDPVRGIPIWRYVPIGSASKQEIQAWLHVMVKALQQWPENEWMRQAAVLIPRWAYKAFRDHMEKLHEMPLVAYIMNQPGNQFTEYNCMGMFLWNHFRSEIAWRNDKIEPTYDVNRIRQFWSWGGLTPEIRHQIEELLQ